MALADCAAYTYLPNGSSWQSASHPKAGVLGFAPCVSVLIRGIRWFPITNDHSRKENIADGIEARLEDRQALREYLLPWTAFSDLISASETRFVEGNGFFPALQNAFPRAYFVLNDRDVEAWLLSRVQHSNGTFLQRAMAYHAADKEAVLDIWRRQHVEHTAKVLDHFAGNPRFIHFHIDRDPIERMVDFLARDFTISASDWRIHKRSKARADSTYSGSYPAASN